MVTTEDSSGDRKLAKYAGNAILLGLKAIEDGPTGLLRRLAVALRDTASMPFLEAAMRQAKDMVGPERLAAPETGTALASLVEDLEEKVPDQRRLDVLRRAFLAIAIGDDGDQDGTMGLVFLRRARSLTGEQVALLAAAYAVRSARGFSTGSGPECTPQEQWMLGALKQSGITLRGPFLREFYALAQLGLISGDEQYRTLGWDEHRGVLTEEGLAFCEFLKRAEPFPAAPEKTPAS